jgi:hypothetical protein
VHAETLRSLGFGRRQIAQIYAQYDSVYSFDTSRISGVDKEEAPMPALPSFRFSSTLISHGTISMIQNASLDGWTSLMC